MRIAEILLYPTVGGAETLVSGLVGRWTEQGHEVETFYLDPPGTSPGRVERVRRLRRALQGFAPDVVHAHSALPNVYARLATRGRTPTVTVLHSAGRSFDIRELRWAEHALTRWTDHVIAVSPQQIEEYREHFGTRTPVTLVPNGMRPDLPHRTSPSAGLATASSLCRFDPAKRLDVLTAGWARAGLEDAELLIAGSARDEETGRRVAEWIDATPRARPLGDVTDVPGLLSRTDLLVHSADVEAHPLAPLEAAVAGVPVVISDQVHPCVPDVPAVVFRAGDPDDLAAALRRASSHYADIARDALAAAPALRERYSIDTCADTHMQVLTDVVASRRR